MSETLLWRSRNDKYHQETCRYADPFLPWFWAEGRTRNEIEAKAARNGVHPCKVCKPLEIVPEVQS